ncbi:MAG: hypothetical protein E7606_05775 [Ruminococcaceae bacterium]|nr:hypothetical protein [Oscillospiraceae bacterium]
MKKMTKILSLVMACVLVCFVFASCAKTLSGTYSAEAGGSFLGGKVSMTFSGKNVTITTTAGVAGFTSTSESKGTYEIAEAADGTQSITITFTGDAEDDAKKFSGTQSFAEGKDEDGNKTIKIGLITLTKAK